MWLVKRGKTLEIRMLGDWVTMKSCEFDSKGNLIRVTYREAKEILELEKIAERAGWFNFETVLAEKEKE